MWCTHCNRAFWWESAEPVKATPQRKITRAQKNKAAVPPPYYMVAECELDRLARLAREQAARDAATTGAAASNTPVMPLAPAEPV